MIHQHRNIGSVFAAIGVVRHHQTYGIISGSSILVYAGQSRFFGTITPMPFKAQTSSVDRYTVEFVLPKKVPSEPGRRPWLHHQGNGCALALATLIFGFVVKGSAAQHQPQIIGATSKQNIRGGGILEPIYFTYRDDHTHFTQRLRANTQRLHLTWLGNVVHYHLHTIKVGRKTSPFWCFEIHLIFTA